MEISNSMVVILTAFIVTAISIIVGIRAHFSSIRAHFQEEKTEIEKNYNRKMGFEEHQRIELQREIESLKQEKEKHIQFLISIPEIVKNLVSNISFEETVSSIFHLLRSLVDPEIIKLYMFDRTANSLLLVHSYGSNEESKNILNVGEGIVGLAAENKMLVSRTSQVSDDGIGIVRVTVEGAWRNCPRYVHRMDKVKTSRYVPRAECETPLAGWKRIDIVQDALPAREQGKAAKAGGLITVEDWFGKLAQGSEEA